MSTVKKARTALTFKRCNGCRGPIERGARYILHTAFPNNDLGNTGFWSLTECAACAASCGRGDLVAAPSPGPLNKENDHA